VGRGRSLGDDVIVLVQRGVVIRHDLEVLLELSL
jgi:hypothetical protein